MATKKKATKTAKKRTSRRVPGSMADQINSLEVGQAVSTAERFPVGHHSAGSADILEACKRNRSNLATYVARITDELDAREFKIESGTFLSDDKSGINVVAVVTRVE